MLVKDVSLGKSFNYCVAQFLHLLIEKIIQTTSMVLIHDTIILEAEKCKAIIIYFGQIYIFKMNICTYVHFMFPCNEIIKQCNKVRVNEKQ